MELNIISKKLENMHKKKRKKKEKEKSHLKDI